MFTPKISITIPKDSGSITVTDITGDSPTDSTGYGQAAYLPQANTEWNKQLYLQRLGSDAEKLTFFPTSDNEAATATISYTFEDGIYLVTEYFTKQLTGLDYVYDSNAKTLTRQTGNTWSDPLGLLEGVYGIVISADENFAISDISAVSSLSGSVLTLSTTLTSGANDADFWVVYRVQKYVLVTNSGEGDLISDIGDMAINAASNGQGCDNETSIKLFNRLLLKFAAQISMNCGNYAKAHNAAVLLSESSTSSATCSTC